MEVMITDCLLPSYVCGSNHAWSRNLSIEDKKLFFFILVTKEQGLISFVYPRLGALILGRGGVSCSIDMRHDSIPLAFKEELVYSNDHITYCLCTLSLCNCLIATKKMKNGKRLELGDCSGL